jgi:hypothetical protein
LIAQTVERNLAKASGWCAERVQRAANALTYLTTLLLVLGVGSAWGEPPDLERTAAEIITPQADQAIHDGLAFLAARQEKDGSLGSSRYRGNVAVTGLCGMAFLASGSTPGRGPYGDAVDGCVRYLLDHVEQSGLIIHRPSASRGPMYGHGFATLFLAECYGMSKRPDLREKLTQALRLIVQTQNNEGGWRYFPVRDDADLSVTVCQVMALRAARNAGLVVPRETIDASVKYVKGCQNPDGGFMYTLQGNEPSQFARSAAALVALQSAGVYEGPQIQNGLRYLDRFAPGEAKEPPGHYYYGHYYAVQTMWQAGGDRWQRWYPAIRDELIRDQLRDGSWESDVCSEYATAMACIVLQVPNDCLPIFQR